MIITNAVNIPHFFPPSFVISFQELTNKILVTTPPPVLQEAELVIIMHLAELCWKELPVPTMIVKRLWQ
jgi:hypothetical protein